MRFHSHFGQPRKEPSRVRGSTTLRLTCVALIMVIPLLTRAEPGHTAKGTSEPFILKPVIEDKAPLESFADPDLQAALEKTLEKLGRSPDVAAKRLGVALVEVTNPSRPRFAAVNPNEMLYAASLPKIAVLFAAFAMIRAGELPASEEIMGRLNRMVRFSSNTDASWVMNRVGKPYIAALLQSPEYRFYDPERGGGLWAGKNYGSGGVWRRDPLENLSHAATPLQVARFFFMLDQGTLIDQSASGAMLEILDDPGIHHKFVAGMRRVGDSARVHRKSGSWVHWHADSALIRHRGRSFILVGLCEHPDGNQWLLDLVVAIDALVQNTEVSGEEIRWVARSSPSSTTPRRR